MEWIEIHPNFIIGQVVNKRIISIYYLMHSVRDWDVPTTTNSLENKTDKAMDAIDSLG